MDSSGYAPVNGLRMYYEIHGTGQPLVLVHGALSGIGTSFGAVLPQLAQHHQVIAVELQAHARTADIDRPLTIPQLASDVIALLDHLGIERADVFGYSVGAAVALEIGVSHPARVRRLIMASVGYHPGALYPGLIEQIVDMPPEAMVGSPFHDEYIALAPEPANWATLVEKVKLLDQNMPTWPAEAIRGLPMPTLLMLGDADIVQPDHALEMFKLLGGASGDLLHRPNAQLAILPGTDHVEVAQRPEIVVPIVEAFLRQ